MNAFDILLETLSFILIFVNSSRKSAKPMDSKCYFVTNWNKWSWSSWQWLWSWSLTWWRWWRCWLPWHSWMCVSDLEPAMEEKSLQRKISRIRARNDDQAQKILRRSRNDGEDPPKRFQMCWGRLWLSNPGDLLILLVMLGGLLDQFGGIGEDPLEKRNNYRSNWWWQSKWW